LRIAGPAHGVYRNDKINGLDVDRVFYRRVNQLDAGSLDGFTVELCGEGKLGCGEVESMGFLDAITDQIRERGAAPAANL
jgi:hypothetical protein